MPFHAEEWWQSTATPNHECNNVNCFYSSLGLAVSTDNGRTFRVAGEILQPSQPLAAFKGGERNMPVGTGSLIVADTNGRHLPNPPPYPGSAYFYLFYSDLSPGLPDACANAPCIGVARASYTDVVAAALSGNPDRVAMVFHKYNGAAQDPWTQPATSDTPDQSGSAGSYWPLWTDDPVSQPVVIYDSSFDLYLAAYQSRSGIKMRASFDLINWSIPIGALYNETGHMLYAPTLLGETGDPTIAGLAPRLYFTSFPINSFPNWKTSTFESVQLRLSQASNSSTITTKTTSVVLPAQVPWLSGIAVLITTIGITAGVGILVLKIRKRNTATRR
jgi:hypothetical protein